MSLVSTQLWLVRRLKFCPTPRDPVCFTLSLLRLFQLHLCLSEQGSLPLPVQVSQLLYGSSYGHLKTIWHADMLSEVSADQFFKYLAILALELDQSFHWRSRWANVKSMSRWLQLTS